MKPTKIKFISHDIIAGILLLSCAILALLINNSQLYTFYDQFLYSKLSIELNGHGLDKPLLLWINDGLMAIFFLLVGLELKRELVEGELREFSKVILPIVGAIGGIIAPIIIYYLFNYTNPMFLSGWAIPMATDIAFALGVLALFSRRVPIQLKLFLLTLAILDDLAAILVIGLFHTSKISWHALWYAQGLIITLIILNILNTKRTSIYIMLGFLLWLVTLQSGFHATIAGVVLAFTIPVKTKYGEQVLHSLEENLKPLVSFMILPIFAFANSGIPLNAMSINDIYHPIVLGIALGLILGKTFGIAFFTILVQKLLKVKIDYNYPSLLGVCVLCGIGFTMSLFISGLSFDFSNNLLNLSRLGIMVGSAVSILLGCLILHLSLPKANLTN